MGDVWVCCKYVVGAAVKPSAAWGQEAAQKFKKEVPPWGKGKPAEGERPGKLGPKDRPRSVLGGLMYIFKTPGLLRLKPLVILVVLIKRFQLFFCFDLRLRSTQC